MSKSIWLSNLWLSDIYEHGSNEAREELEHVFIDDYCTNAFDQSTHHTYHTNKSGAINELKYINPTYNLDDPLGIINKLNQLKYDQYIIQETCDTNTLFKHLNVLIIAQLNSKMFLL